MEKDGQPLIHKRPRRLRPLARLSGDVANMTPADRSLVSVIIPCYNYERYIAECIESVLVQPFVDVEVIVVDDCSTDASARIVSEIAAGDSRVVLHRNDVNRGPVATFNAGLDHATGSYLVRLDADDMLTPGSLGRAVALFEKFPNVGLVYGHPLHFFDGSVIEGRTKVDGWTVWAGRDWLRERCRWGTNCITSPEVVMRRDVVRQVGGQSLELPQTHDMEMWLRLAAVADVAYIRGVDQAFHREHALSRSATMVTAPIIDLRERVAAFDVFFSGLGGSIKDSDEFQRLAACAIARAALDRACRLYDRGPADVNLADEFVVIAFSAYPGAASMPEWRRLARRRRVGPRYARYVPSFFAYAAWRRFREMIAYRRWKRIGV